MCLLHVNGYVCVCVCVCVVCVCTCVWCAQFVMVCGFSEGTATLPYDILESGELEYSHTEVPESCRGKGLGAVLAKVSGVTRYVRLCVCVCVCVCMCLCVREGGGGGGGGFRIFWDSLAGLQAKQAKQQSRIFHTVLDVCHDALFVPLCTNVPSRPCPLPFRAGY